MNKAIRRYMAKLGAKGGVMAAQSLTKQERSERARKAGLARQAKARQGREN